MKTKKKDQVGKARIPLKVCHFRIDEFYAEDRNIPLSEWKSFFENYIIHPEEKGSKWEEEPAFDYEGELVFENLQNQGLEAYKSFFPFQIELVVYRPIEQGLLCCSYTHTNKKGRLSYILESIFFCEQRVLKGSNDKEVMLSTTHNADQVRNITQASNGLLNEVLTDVRAGSPLYSLVPGETKFYPMR